MEMTKAIISGSSTALSLVKTLLMTPILYEKDQMKKGVPLECNAYSQNGTAEVSESMIITLDQKDNESTETKKLLADNVAPSSWTWNIQGYIPGLSLVELTNLYPWVMIRNRNKIRDWFKQGAVLKFKDMEGKIYDNVAIESLDIRHDPDCANKAPFSITLKEINVMSAKEFTTEGAVENATADKDAPATDMGSNATKATELPTSTAAGGSGYNGAPLIKLFSK